MPRQNHLTLSDELKERCWAIAKARREPATWQEVAREALSAGLATLAKSTRAAANHR